MSPCVSSPPASPRIPKLGIEDLVNTPTRNGRHHKHIIDCSIFSSSVDCNGASDIILTPPVASSQSLVVAAKRHSSAIREANGSKRRRRRRQQYSNSLDLSSIFVRVTANPKSAISYFGVKDDNFACDDIKVDATKEFPPMEKMTLSYCQAKMMSPEVMTKTYWEWCYGKGTTAAEPIPSNSFSAKRMPPSKGW
jgi:hypothetical protein